MVPPGPKEEKLWDISSRLCCSPRRLACPKGPAPTGEAALAAGVTQAAAERTGPAAPPLAARFMAVAECVAPVASIRAASIRAAPMRAASRAMDFAPAAFTAGQLTTTAFKAGFAAAREIDEADEAGNVMRAREWVLAV